MSRQRWWFLILGVLLMIGIPIVHIFTSNLHVVVTVTAVGFGTLLLAMAALIGAWVKLREYRDRIQDLEKTTDQLETKFNGGMAEVMAQVLNDEIQSGSFQIELVRRVADLEGRVDEADSKAEAARLRAEQCEQREKEWQRLKARIGSFLDENGGGRAEEREVEA